MYPGICPTNAKYVPGSGLASLKFFEENFKRVTVFRLGHHLSKHKMIIHARNLGGLGPLATNMYVGCREKC